MKNIKAILFDLDGTLRQHLPSAGEIFSDYIIGLGLRNSDEDNIRAARWEHFYFANSPEIQADQKTFKDDHPGFWVNFCRRRLIALGLHPSQAIELSSKVSAHMNEVYKPVVHVPEDARALLPDLQKAGYILGVVSNREKPYQAELEELGLALYFKFSLAAGEVPSYKPESPIFLRALELAGTSAADTIYVGDNYFADAVGSHRAGLQPVLYDPIHLFPDAEYPVIESFDELLPLVKTI